MRPILAWILGSLILLSGCTNAPSATTIDASDDAAQTKFTLAILSAESKVCDDGLNRSQVCKSITIRATNPGSGDIESLDSCAWTTIFSDGSAIDCQRPEGARASANAERLAPGFASELTLSWLGRLDIQSVLWGTPAGALALTPIFPSRAQSIVSLAFEAQNAPSAPGQRHQISVLQADDQTLLTELQVVVGEGPDANVSVLAPYARQRSASTLSVGEFCFTAYANSDEYGSDICVSSSSNRRIDQISLGGMRNQFLAFNAGDATPGTPIRVMNGVTAQQLASLQLPKPSGIVAGRAFLDDNGNGVFDELSETALGNVNLAIGDVTVTTSADGTYLAEGVSAGLQNVTSASDDYEVAVASSRVRVPVGASVTHHLALEPRSAIVAGRLLADFNGDGSLSEDEGVEFQTLSFTADASAAGNTARSVHAFTEHFGDFTVHLRPGTYLLTAEHAPDGIANVFRLSERLNVLAGETMANKRLVMSKA